MKPSRFASIALGSIAWLALAVFAQGTSAQNQTAVEYFHVGWGYYFMTSFPDEIAVLDGGAFGGVWQRTGETFNVSAQPAAGALPTCRFFSTSFAPMSTHFYTPFDAECQTVKNSRDWQFESIAFYLALPEANGTCAAGTATLYRLYNNGMGGAPNHRYTASRATFDNMRAAGWVPEGDGVTFAFACIPASNVAGAAEGKWVGQTNLGEAVRGYVLDDGTYYFAVTPPGGEPTDVLQGTAIANNGTLTASDGVGFPVASGGQTSVTSYPARVSGTFVPRKSISLSITPGTRTVTASYDASYELPANLDMVAGTYTGYSGHGNGGIGTTFAVDAGGRFVGDNPICSYAGSVTPRKSVNVFDLALRGTSAGCVMGADATITGIMVYDDVQREFFGLAPFNARSDSYHLVGTRK
jgi:hypothetical protein